MRKKIITGCLITALLGVSCSSDYLETEPTQFLSTEQVGEAAENNPAVARALMNGVYSLMFETGTGGTNLNHDDFGQKGYDLYGDLLSSDMALSLSTYGWYRNTTEYQTTQDFTQIINYQVWRYYYRIIRSCNLVIDANGGNEGEPEGNEGRWILGQAKALRAHSYFYLAQYYANDYDPSQEILPIYTTPDPTNVGKSTTAEVYELIVNDLNHAIALLEDFNRTEKNQVNKSVAQGILAYVYGVMGNNTEVKALTDEIIASGAFPLMSESEVLGGFNNVNTPGWMWGMDLTLDNGLDLVSWWGQMDLFTYSYAWAGDRKTIDFDLFNEISDDDIRKQQFYNDPSSPYYLMPINKFYDTNRVIGGQRFIEMDYIYMRVAEMYLLNAEAAAKIGDEAGAKARLQELLANRIPDVSYVNGLSGQALLDEIYLQTRIELWGEGKSYLNLKRNHGSTMRGPNHLSNIGETIQYDDERLTFEIPESEIQNNPFVNLQN